MYISHLTHTNGTRHAYRTSIDTYECLARHLTVTQPICTSHTTYECLFTHRVPTKIIVDWSFHSRDTDKYPLSRTRAGTQQSTFRAPPNTAPPTPGGASRITHARACLRHLHTDDTYNRHTYNTHNLHTHAQAAHVQPAHPRTTYTPTHNLHTYNTYNLHTHVHPAHLKHVKPAQAPAPTTRTNATQHRTSAASRAPPAAPSTTPPAAAYPRPPLPPYPRAPWHPRPAAPAN